ncbi:MAG TPA: hypothetical protein VLG50_00250 [Candidatus Saccharimonadales bacterium]|nr:hypothetical protein [Candidatus Saccharimonadales bacterium]
MKISLKLMITLCIISMPYISAAMFDPVANQKGKIYDALPSAVQKSGKLLELNIPKSATASTVQIVYFYPIANSKQTHGGMIQTIQFAPNQTSKTVSILPPANPKKASIMINAMPYDIWKLHVQAAGQKGLDNALNKEILKNPVYHVQFQYENIKPNQIIALTVPVLKKQKLVKTKTKIVQPAPIQKPTLWSDIKKDIQHGEEDVENFIEKI